MSAPYVSSRRLVANSLSAMLSAIEIYNKPQIAYREEVRGRRKINVVAAGSGRDGRQAAGPPS
jgi:hypothetical protein